MALNTKPNAAQYVMLVERYSPVRTLTGFQYFVNEQIYDPPILTALIVFDRLR